MLLGDLLQPLRPTRLVLVAFGFAWLDTGTPDSLLEASEFVRAIQHRQALQIASPDEIAWNNGWIDDAELRQRAASYGKTGYGGYLARLVE